jgi:hypothetical protein
VRVQHPPPLTRRGGATVGGADELDLRVLEQWFQVPHRLLVLFGVVVHGTGQRRQAVLLETHDVSHHQDAVIQINIRTRACGQGRAGSAPPSLLPA